MFQLLERTIHQPLFSTDSTLFLRYYELIRLAILLLYWLILYSLYILFSRDSIVSLKFQYHIITYSPHPQTPEKFIYSHHNDYINSACCLLHNISLFILSAISGLDSFTFSHYGSYAPLSTLTPNVTTLEPRLGTSCWLGSTRQVLLLYDISLNPLKKNIGTQKRCLLLLIFQSYEILLAHRALAKFYLTYKAKRKPTPELVMSGLLW